MSTNNGLTTIATSRDQLLDSALINYLKHPTIMNIFKPMTIEEILDLALDLEKWSPPEHFQTFCSHKFVGYDPNNRPIWVCKPGDVTVKDIINRGEVEQLERYFWLVILSVIKSIVAKSLEENPSQQAVCIVDAGDVTNYRKFLHGPSVALIYKMAQKYKDGCHHMLGLGIGVNIKQGGVVSFFLKYLRPLVRQTLDKVEMYGKEESIWRPRLAELFGKDEIPNFEGTHSGFDRLILAP